MKFFGRMRSGNARAEAAAQPAADATQGNESTSGPAMVLRSPKDKYGMMDIEETEMPSPAFNGMQAKTKTEPERYETGHESPETVDHGVDDGENGEENTGGETTGDELSPRKKKKKKKKKKHKKKKKSAADNTGDDAPLIIDRVPTAMEYESDDSIEKMMDERSRYSRYTTEYDELDLDTFDDGEGSVDPTDKYAGVGTIELVMSNDSNPPMWRSWDEEEEKKKKGNEKKKKSRKKIEKAQQEGDGSQDQQSQIHKKPSNLSKRSKGSQGKKYKDLREFRKSKSTDKQKSSAASQPQVQDDYEPYELQDFNADRGAKDTKIVSKDSNGSETKIAGQNDKNRKAVSPSSRDSDKKDQVQGNGSGSWIAYNNTLSGTFEKSTKESIPPTVSDTSSLTDPHKKNEKYAAQIAAAEQQGIAENADGPPLEIATKPPQHPSKSTSENAIRDKNIIQSLQNSKDAASASGIPVLNQEILPATSTGSSEKHNRYHVESPANGEADRGLGSINQSNSESTSSSSRRRRSAKTAAKPHDRYAEIKQKLSNSTEARSNRSSPKTQKKKGHTGDFMYTKSLMTDDSSYMNEISPIHRTEKTKRGQMKELDEYSVAISVQDDPAFVQCLKFYHCAAAATLAGFASSWLPLGNTVSKEVKMLGRGPDLDEVDKMRYREESGDPGGLNPVSPKVEVTLEAEDERSSVDEDRDDATVDAPDLKAADPNTNSYLREVTSLALRLDNDGLEEKRQQPALDRGRAMAAEAKVDVGISEIAIPHSSSLKIQKRLAKQKQQEESEKMQREAAAQAVKEVEATDDKAKESSEEPSKETVVAEEPAPEIEIIDKKNSGSSEESSRPASSKKGFSKIFSRFGRRSKRKSLSSGSGAPASE